jgi:hypothetical protein
LNSRFAIAHRNLGRLLIGVIYGLLCTQSYADTIAKGIVIDLATEAPIAGAKVTVRKDGTPIGDTLSDAEGRFQCSFNVGVAPEAQNLTLVAERTGYLAISRSAVVASGKLDSQSYRFELLPTPLASCRRNRSHAVIVGYFRPPISADAKLELSGRIAEALNGSLLLPLQKRHMRVESQPFIIECPDAHPSASRDGTSYAKALGADIFLFGSAAPAGTKFRIEMSVADRFGVLVPPVRTSTRLIDLDYPIAARFDRDTYIAIFTGLLTGYLKSQKFADCVETGIVAQELLGDRPAAIKEAYGECYRSMRHQGLLPRTGGL